jgi:hypothetical protein
MRAFEADAGFDFGKAQDVAFDDGFDGSGFRHFVEHGKDSFGSEWANEKRCAVKRTRFEKAANNPHWLLTVFFGRTESAPEINPPVDYSWTWARGNDETGQRISQVGR